jgi:hypothetical protein
MHEHTGDIGVKSVCICRIYMHIVTLVCYPETKANYYLQKAENLNLRSLQPTTILKYCNSVILILK